MNVSITPELEKFIETKLRGGMYQSASELVREALRLLEARDALHQRRIELMDQYIQEGLDSGNEDDLISPAMLHAQLDSLSAEIAPNHAADLRS
jgi:antitoxin ParD1/3/4